MKFKFTEAERNQIAIDWGRMTNLQDRIDRIEAIISERPAADQTGAEELREEARQYIVDKGFLGFANNSSVPGWMADFAAMKVSEAVEKVKEEEYEYHLSKRVKMVKVIHNFRDKVYGLNSQLAESKRRVAELE